MKIFRVYKTYGLRYLLSVIVNMLIRKIGIYDGMALAKEKIFTDSNHIFRRQIYHGPFKGMKLSKKIWWGRYDTLTKYLGQYEPHVLGKLQELSNEYDHFIDLGAADGYYAVGALYSNMFATSTCFEISEIGKSVILENALKNHVRDKIKILGKADPQSILEEIKISGSSVILSDIEGGEFELFSKTLLQEIKNCSLIIELHDDCTAGKTDRRERLLRDASEFFNVSYLHRVNPGVNEIDVIKDWNDDLRHLAFSENRSLRQSWLLLTPINS